MTCTPMAPRLAVATDAEAPAEPRYGLFSTATLVEDMAAHAHHGVQYVTTCDPNVHAYPLTDCTPGTPPTNPTKTSERTRATAVADPFAIYAAEACFPGGDDETAARDNLRRRILRGERHTVEAIIDSGRAGAVPYLRHPDTTVITPGTGHDLQTAIGLLEQKLAEAGRTGIIHAPRWAAAPMDGLGIVHRDGPRARTLLGTPVAFGSGYSGRPPEGVDDTAAAVWLYATPHVTIRRSVIIEPASWSDGAFNPRTNQPFLLAERVYVVDWPCDTWAVQTTRDRVYTAAPPADPAPGFTLTPTSGTTPLEVTATVDNWGNGPVEVDWGDGTATETVDDGATATHTYTDPDTYTATATSQADPEAVATATVTAAAPVSPPADLTTDPTATTVDAAWTWTQGEGPAADGFRIRYRPTGGTWSAWNHLPADARTHTFTDLTPGTGYEIGVQAMAADGATSTETTATFTTQANVAAPAVSVGTPTTTTIPTTWTWTQGTGEDATDMQVRHRATGGTWPAWTSVGAGTRSHTFTGLDPATEYEVEVQAAGATTTASDSATATTAAEPLELTVTPTSGASPLDVTATADNHGQGEVSIDWGDGTTPDTNPGDGTTTTAHTFDGADTYTVVATDPDTATRTDSVDVTVTAP